MNLDRRLIMGTGLGLGVGLGMALGAGNIAAQERRQAAPAGPRASASDLGVAPDSGRDETARLQAAIDKAAERHVALHLPAGRYLSRSLTLRHGSILTGVPGATVLQHTGGAALLSGEGGDLTSLDGLTLIGGRTIDPRARGLVEFDRSPHIALRNLTIEASPTNGIALTGCSGLVTGCRISGALKAALFSLDAEGLEISHNTINSAADNGILVWRSEQGVDGTIVAMNRIEGIGARSGGTGQNGNGINVYRAGGVLVTSNRIADCAFSAVRANSASDVQILANSAAGMGEVGLYVEFAFQGAVISGNLVDGATTGISVTNFNEGGRLAVVQGNLVRNLVARPGEAGPSGVGIAVEADTAVTGNTIEGAPLAGLLIGWGRFCRDVTASGNVIRNSGIGIAVTGDANAGAVLISGNLISGSTRGAIRMMDHGRPIGDDLAREPVTTGRVRVSGNVAA